MNIQTHTTSTRLASLDILRGGILFLLVFFQPILVAVLTEIDTPWSSGILYQFDHEVWDGFRFWDLVMPLFLFMSGTSIPFSFSKMMREKTKVYIYRKVFKRFFILFILGMILQGNLLGFDMDHIYFYTNTLQAIGTGYLFTAIILLNFKFRTQIAISGILLLIYSIPFIVSGDYTMDGNFASKVDQMILGRFRGDPSYSWIWSSLAFTVTVLLGSFAGHIMKEYKENKKKVLSILFTSSLCLIVAALICSIEIPVNKRIWSASMTLLSGGYCFFLMGLFYYWIDYCGHLKGLEWLKIYGMNSIVAYFLGEMINFRSIAYSVSYGLEPFLGEFYPAWITFLNFSILFLILYLMYKSKIFIKI